MKCLEWREKISGYIDREIPDAEIGEVEGHLEACESCRALERRMRAVGTGVTRLEAAVSPDFRDRLFARMEAEELLPRRRSLFAFSLRWAAIPLAAAAAFGLFLLVSPEKSKVANSPQEDGPRVAQSAPVERVPEGGTSSRGEVRQHPAASGKGQPAPAGVAALSLEEREMVAYLDVLEDPAALDEQGDQDAIDMFVPSGSRRG